MNTFHKIAGYNINIQKSLPFLYTSNKRSERESKETIPFTIATKRIKYLGINLLKETEVLYAENYKTLIKEINDGTNRLRDIPYSLINSSNFLVESLGFSILSCHLQIEFYFFFSIWIPFYLFFFLL